MNSKTAILLFSRSPQEEAEAKDYFCQKKAGHAIQLTKKLRENSLKVAKECRLPVIDFLSKYQEGFTFGEKIIHALKSSFEKGYDSIILIGIDSPGLNYRHILKAHALLKENHKTVLGPSKDGGVYLIGIKKNNFNADQILNLAWQTTELQSSWNEIQEEIYWLNPLADIDEASDLWNFTALFQEKLKSFRQIVFIILKLYRRSFLPLKSQILKTTLSPAFIFRAPPQ